MKKFWTMVKNNGASIPNRKSETGSRAADSVSVEESVSSDGPRRSFSLFLSPRKSRMNSSSRSLPTPRINNGASKRRTRGSVTSTISMLSESDLSTSPGLSPHSPVDIVIEEHADLGASAEELTCRKLGRVLADRSARDLLVDALLSSHSPLVLIIRFLTAVNELQVTTNKREWSRKAAIIVACFVGPNARFRIDMPADFVQGLSKKKTRAFSRIQEYFIRDLSLDSRVTAFLAMLDE